MLFFKNKENNSGTYVAVSSGNLMPLEKVKDEAFSSKILGDGLAIDIDDDYIVSPCNGTITMLYPTLHAFGIRDENGVDILVHIGIDTVNLKGKGFKKLVNQGDKVKAGEKVIKIDSYNLKNNNYDLTTMMLFPNCSKTIKYITNGYAKKGATVVASIEGE